MTEIKTTATNEQSLIGDLVKTSTARETIGEKQFNSWDNPIGYYLVRAKFQTANAEYSLPKMGKLSTDTVDRKCFYKTIRQARATSLNFNTQDLDYFLLFIDSVMRNEQDNCRIVGDEGNCELYSYNGQMEAFDMQNNSVVLNARLEVRVIYDNNNNITNASIKICPIGGLKAEEQSRIISLAARLVL